MIVLFLVIHLESEMDLNAKQMKMAKPTIFHVFFHKTRSNVEEKQQQPKLWR